MKIIREYIEFERGGNPLDTLQIGNRLARLRGVGESLPVVRHLFNDMDPDNIQDYDEEETEELIAMYGEAKKAFIDHGLDFAAVLDYAIEQEDELPDYWSEIDEYGTMGDVVDEWGGATREEFREWALAVLEHFRDGFDIDTAEYEKIIEEIK